MLKLSLKRPRIHILSNRWIVALPGLFYLANLARMLGLGSLAYLFTLVVGGGVGFAYYLIQRDKNIRIFIPFFWMYIFTLLLNWLIINNVGASEIASSVLLVGISLLMLLQPWSKKYGAVVFYLTAALFYNSMRGATTRQILTSSSNYISVLLLLACAYYYIAVERNSGKIRLIDLIPSFISLYISIWAGGRGGILAFTFLTVCLLILYLKTITSRNAKRAVIIACVLMFAILIVAYRNISLIQTFMGLGRWADRGADNSSRSAIWSSYISKAFESFLYLLFGAPLSRIPIINVFEGNTHNSFLQLHAYNGIIMFVVVFVMIFTSLWSYIKTRQYIMTAIMMTIIIRGMTDKFIFCQYGMPIQLFFILYPGVSLRNTNTDEYY